MHQPCRGILVRRQATVQEDGLHHVRACAILLGWARGVDDTAARRRWRSLTCSITSQNDIRCSDIITAIKLPPTTGPFQDHPHFTEETHLRAGCMCTFIIVVCIMRIFIAFAVLFVLFCCLLRFFALSLQCHLYCQFISNNRSFSGPPTEETHIRVGCMCTFTAFALLLR